MNEILCHECGHSINEHVVGEAAIVFGECQYSVCECELTPRDIAEHAIDGMRRQTLNELYIEATEHYWDTLSENKNVILAHLSAIIKSVYSYYAEQERAADKFNPRDIAILGGDPSL